MCCSNGKIVLPDIVNPPEPLNTYMNGNTIDSKHFLKNIRKYNSCFQMTSFGATKIVNNLGYMPTFKVQGQIYHQIGSLLPERNGISKFLQIYFLGGDEEEINQRCAITTGIDREIITKLQKIFHCNNQLIQLFKTALERMPHDEFKIIIRADKKPSGEHEKRYNAPIIDETAVVMIGIECESRDIVIFKRDSSLKYISATHRSYDPLQYPIIFWNGDDGYQFNIYQVETNKKV